MTAAIPERRLVVVLVLVLILPIAACGWWRTPTADTRGAVTVIDRTTNALTVTDTKQTFTVAGCGESSASNFLINSWQITVLGREWSTGRGSFGPHAYILVTAGSDPQQSDARPPNPPACEGVPARLE